MRPDEGTWTITWNGAMDPPFAQAHHRPAPTLRDNVRAQPTASERAAAARVFGDAAAYTTEVERILREAYPKVVTTNDLWAVIFGAAPYDRSRLATISRARLAVERRGRCEVIGVVSRPGQRGRKSSTFRWVPDDRRAAPAAEHPRGQRHLTAVLVRALAAAYPGALSTQELAEAVDQGAARTGSETLLRAVSKARLDLELSGVVERAPMRGGPEIPRFRMTAEAKAATAAGREPWQ